MAAICRCFESLVSLDGTLSKKETAKRKIFFMYPVIGLMFIISGIITRRNELSGQYVSIMNYACSLASFTFSITLILCKVPLNTSIVVGVMYFQCILMFTGDLTGRSLGYERWPIIVVGVDYLLVMEVPTRYTTGLVCVTLVWLFIMALEQSYRFGILDMPGLMPQEGEYGRKEYYRMLTDCESPPCATGKFPPTTYYVSSAVFIIDFFATRGFARNVLKEQASMAQTISTVQEIASLLAGYDVEKVAELLEAHGTDLPEGMLLALSTLEANLRVYKAYLPQTCLPFDKGSSEDTDGQKLTEENQMEASMTGSDSMSITNSLVMKMATRVQPLGITSIKATLMTLNMKDTLHQLEEDSTRFSDLFTSMMLKTLGATDSQKGMVDVFIGDRIHCSFNASKRCASHANCALYAAAALVRIESADDCAPVNIGIATGKVLRGDMGCEMMRRFSMIGTLVRDVNGMERAGRILGCDVLCNRLCFSDGELEHQLRLIPRKVEVDAGCDEEVVAELVVKEGNIDISIADEWMYMIGGKKDWDAYNSSVRAYFKGEASAADVAAAAYEASAASTEKKQPPARMFVSDEKDETLRLPLRVLNNESRFDAMCIRSV